MQERKVFAFCQLSIARLPTLGLSWHVQSSLAYVLILVLICEHKAVRLRFCKPDMIINRASPTPKRPQSDAKRMHEEDETWRRECRAASSVGHRPVHMPDAG